MIASDRRYSLDEYRTIEEKAEERSEYRDGEIVPMAGGTLKHSRIGGNIFAFLKFLLRDTQFELINSDLRLPWLYFSSNWAESVSKYRVAWGWVRKIVAGKWG